MINTTTTLKITAVSDRNAILCEVYLPGNDRIVRFSVCDMYIGGKAAIVIEQCVNLDGSFSLPVLGSIK